MQKGDGYKSNHLVAMIHSINYHCITKQDNLGIISYVPVGLLSVYSTVECSFFLLKNAFFIVIMRHQFQQYHCINVWIALIYYFHCNNVA